MAKYYLIDPKSTPYSSAAEIRSEIAQIKARIKRSPQRAEAVAQLERWLVGAEISEAAQGGQRQ